jgi:transposase-like protein
MDPQAQFCHNHHCPKRGKAGHNNIEIHSRKERRYRCKRCQRTFSETRGTPFYRLHKPAELFTIVLTLLCHGCPIQAVVAAFGLDERTVAAWQMKAGQHCQKLHEHLISQGKVELEHVQADELWVKLVGKKVWMAMAMAVPSRLWLGGGLRVHRDYQLITTVAQLVRACAASPAVLVCVDGLASYVKAFGKVWRKPLRTGRRGRPKLG